MPKGKHMKIGLFLFFFIFGCAGVPQYTSAEKSQIEQCTSKLQMFVDKEDIKTPYEVLDFFDVSAWSMEGVKEIAKQRACKQNPIIDAIFFDNAIPGEGWALSSKSRSIVKMIKYKK